MTREEARALIPPGWVECDQNAWIRATDRIAVNRHGFCLYAIPAPNPEPRRVPMTSALVILDKYGTPSISSYWSCSAVGQAYANTKWRLDPDAREWVEVLD